jgi:hypothetical protein
MTKPLEDDPNVRLLTTSRTEKDVALDLKARLVEALAPVLALCREANGSGLDVHLPFSRDNFGVLQLIPVVSKHY